MTPAARHQAAIEVLDAILAGASAEQALSAWARRSRFAGSKDRAALRDIVFDALRCQRSHAALGAAPNGRGLVLGGVLDRGLAPEEIFSGIGHAPAPLSAEEQRHVAALHADPSPYVSEAEACDLPDWLWPGFCESLGAQAISVAQALRQRAPVCLRVNTARIGRDDARRRLSAEGIETEPSPLAASALIVQSGARAIKAAPSYLEGLVELQDVSSQAAIEALPLRDGMRVLDYCAGGGGKALAMAARAQLALFAHDAFPRRMQDLPVRAGRAGAQIKVLAPEELATQEEGFDLILCDAPCSGSGSWRRDPEGKWRLTPTLLDETLALQAQILRDACSHLRPGGFLAYATCSMLEAENGAQIEAFCAANPDWEVLNSYRWRADAGSDGFFLCVMQAPRHD